MKTAVLALCGAVSAFGGGAGHNHSNHNHQHEPNCGHLKVVRGDHVDYLHDGHLHHVRPDGSIEEYAIEVSQANPSGHTGIQGVRPSANSPRIRHANHYDHVVNDRLSHKHGDHYDDHGPVRLQSHNQSVGHMQQFSPSAPPQNCVPVICCW